MTDAALQTVARNIRAARAAAGLSLDALAARAEVSKGALVAVEAARGNPNLTTLVRLADALGRSVSSLLDTGNDDLTILVNGDQVVPLWAGPSGGSARLLLTNPRPNSVEVWRWRLYPGERYDSHAHPAGVTETITILKGRMSLIVDRTTYELHTGTTILFASDAPHAYQGTGRGPCELIMTVHLPGERHDH
jgi:quercetin dioxygenase-like cupin family protein/DNA-binding XRE family transcriptional regulator